MEKRGYLVVAVIIVAVFSIWIFSRTNFLAENQITGGFVKVTGMVAAGQNCRTNIDCDQGLYCFDIWPQMNNASVNPPICQPKVGLFMPCKDNSWCQSNLCGQRQGFTWNVCLSPEPAACASDAACAVGKFCENNVCVNKLPNVSTCIRNEQCSSGLCDTQSSKTCYSVQAWQCIDDSTCQQGQICRNGAHIPRQQWVCSNKLAINEMCWRNEACLSTFCDLSSRVTCTRNPNTNDNRCTNTLLPCQTNNDCPGRCTMPVQRGCSVANEAVDCPALNGIQRYCDDSQQPSVCASKWNLGGQCTTDRNCASGSWGQGWCNSQTRRCDRRPVACSTDVDCVNANLDFMAVCLEGTCQAKGHRDQACLPNNTCKDNLICYQGTCRVSDQVPRQPGSLNGPCIQPELTCQDNSLYCNIRSLRCEPLLRHDEEGPYDVLRISSSTNAHGALASNTQYPVAVRISPEALSQPPANPRECGNNNQHLVLRLSSDTNAHAAVKTYNQYITKVCHSGLSQCGLSQNQCPQGKIPIVKLSSESNAHLSLVDQPGYTNIICCTVTSAEVRVAEQPPARGGEGQPCIAEQNNQCDLNLICQNNICVRGQPAGPQPGTLDQACRAENDPLGRCNAPLTCQNNLCKQLLLQGAQGQACRAADPKCNVNLECKENICQPKVFTGEAPSQCSVPELKQQLIQTYGDADQDNVPDGFCDQCPGTPADKRANVNAVGCAPQDTSKPSRGVLKCEDMDGIYCGSNSCAQGIAMPVTDDPLRIGGICCVPDQSGSTPKNPLCRSEQPPASLGDQVGEVREGPCNDPDGDGLGTKQYYDQNNNQIGAPQSCTTIPREQVITEPVPFYSLFSSILTLVLLIGFYIFRKDRLRFD